MAGPGRDDARVSIPMLSERTTGIASLNVAIAGAILMHQLRRWPR